ncbi:MAG: hypothetical protein HPY69_09695 [Armatimonadetes bacterium]|nr:hypothetical protein [Armatimonadota bacterium]
MGHRLLTAALACVASSWAVLAAPMTSRSAGPFTFVYGLERLGDLPVVRDLGLNTLYVDLRPADLADLEPCRTLIRAAHSEGLQVIVGLPTTEPVAGRVGPCDTPYRESVREIITFAVSRLRSEPAVTAWATGHSLERTLKYSDQDFRAYLQLGYPSLDHLNASWGSNLQTWMQVTMDSARAADEAQSHGVGRASVDLADYQVWAFREVMRDWLETIRSLDPDRPVLTGRVTLYRSLVSIPDGYDMVCVSMPPDILEPDLYAHNVHALDIARRGGRFRVLQVLRCPHPSSDAYATDAFRDWLQLAAVHGAAGIAVEDWSLLEVAYAGEVRQDGHRRLTEALRETANLPFGIQPQPTAAVLYEPYAEGLQVTNQPVYGYLRDLLPGEPSSLAYALRLGTRYGVMDYLTLEDLADADLRRYGVVMAPACLKLGPAEAELLAGYVRSGGAVLADLGLGMYQSNSWVQLPKPWMEVCGLQWLGNLEGKAGDLAVAAQVPELPSVQPGMRSHAPEMPRQRVEGLYRSTAVATDRRPFSVIGETAEGRANADALAFAHLALRFDEQRQACFRGLIANRYGAGLAVFATHALWSRWPLTDALSQALHGDLLARRARYALTQTGLLQENLHFAGSADDVLLFNRERGAQVAEVLAFDAEGLAYQGGCTQFTAAPTQVGLPPGTARLLALVPGRGTVHLQRRPVLVQPLSGEAMVQVVEYTPQRVELVVGGSDATVRSWRDRRLEMVASRPCEVRLLLRNGAYAVRPGSRHTVTLTWRAGESQTATLIASPEGELDLSGAYRLDTLVITPAP